MVDQDPVSIGKGLSDIPEFQPDRKKSRRDRHRRQTTPERPKAPTASERSSEVAQRWMDLAEGFGYRLPFNTNWLAHQISDRVVHDQRFKPFLGEGRHDDVVRWLLKMVDLFWKEYVQEGDTNATVANVFFDDAWDDVREYAFDSLRAAYLKEHGVRRPRKDWLEENPEDVASAQELQEGLRKIRFDAWLEEAVAVSKEPIPELRKLEPRHREMLKSRREQRGKTDEGRH